MEIRVGILTISDRSSRGEREDRSGPALVDYSQKQGWLVVKTLIVPDEVDIISKTFIQWADDAHMDLILSTGGTGFAPRDVTPEATLAVIHKLTPGISEFIRQESGKITPHAVLSRAVAGIRHQTLIINLPGSPKGAVESISFVQPVLDHAIELIKDNPASESHHTNKPSR